MTEAVENYSLDEEAPLRRHWDFNWLWIGGAASFLGDHITLIAFPWLVLSLTQESWVLGAVLALMGLPRGVFIFVGGAIVDRMSPKTVLLYSKYINAVFLLSLALLIYLNQLTIPVLCLFSLLIGIGSAFALPAGSAILPGVVGRKRLETANGVFFILHKLAMFVGPLLAGVLLASDAQAGEELAADTTKALALLFALDGLSFVFSALTLTRVNYYGGGSAAQQQGILRSVWQGFVYFWACTQLRAAILYMAAVSSVVGGLILVGLPILVQQQLLAGGDSFGYLMAINGLGTIVGLILAGKKPKLGTLTLGMTFLLGDIIVGGLVASFFAVESLSLAYSLFFVIGILAGYIQLAVYTWVQKQSSAEMLGRIMAIMMFTIMGLAPIAAAVYGVILDYVSVGPVFLTSGLLLIAVALLGLNSAQLRSIERIVD